MSTVGNYSPVKAYVAFEQEAPQHNVRLSHTFAKKCAFETLCNMINGGVTPKILKTKQDVFEHITQAYANERFEEYSVAMVFDVIRSNRLDAEVVIKALTQLGTRVQIPLLGMGHILEDVGRYRLVIHPNRTKIDVSIYRQLGTMRDVASGMDVMHFEHKNGGAWVSNVLNAEPTAKMKVHYDGECGLEINRIIDSGTELKALTDVINYAHQRAMVFHY